MSFRCPNPNCLKDFPTSRAAFVHLGNSTKCKSWEKISISRRFEETSDSEDTESTPDVTVVKLPWRKIKPLPERAPKFEFQVPIIPEDQAPTDRGETNGETSAPLESASHLPPTTPSVQPSRVIDEHPNAGYAFGSGQTILDQIREDPQRQENMFHPFRDSDDFEMGAWLIQSGISMAEIDNFLKLPWVGKSSRLVAQLYLKLLLGQEAWTILIQVGKGTSQADRFVASASRLERAGNPCRGGDDEETHQITVSACDRSFSILVWKSDVCGFSGECAI